MKDIVGLIPAAGKGVRLGLPYPKELFPIIQNNRYKPVSQYILENMIRGGIKHVVMVINETKHQLVGYYGNGSRFDNINISYVAQEYCRKKGESTSPGLANALNSAYHLIKAKTVCFGMADTIIKPNTIFKTLIKESKDADVVLGLFPTNTPQKFGMVKCDSKGTVIKIIDKPKRSKLKYMWGVIVWQPVFTEFLNDQVNQGQMDFAQILNSGLASGMNFKGVKFKRSKYLDLGTFEELKKLYEKYTAT